MEQGGVGPFVFRRKIIKNPDLDDAQPPAPSPMALGLQISQGQWQAKMDGFFHSESDQENWSHTFPWSHVHQLWLIF